jgi:hypothetical protein
MNFSTPIRPSSAPFAGRLAAVAAIGLSSITLRAAAQAPTPTPGLSPEEVYSPPPPSASVYRPGPVIAYSTVSSSQSNVTGSVPTRTGLGERDRNDDRLLTILFFSGVATFFVVGFFCIINQHNRQEEENEKKNRRP